MKNRGGNQSFLPLIIFIILLFVSIACNISASTSENADQENNLTGQAVGTTLTVQPSQNQSQAENEKGTSEKNEFAQPSNHQQPQSHSQENLNPFSDNAIPFFVFNRRDLFVIDYEKNRYSINGYAYNINKDYAIDYGDSFIYETSSGETIAKYQWNNCDSPLFNFLTGNFLVIICIFDEQPELNKIQAWDLSKNSFLGEIPLGPDGIQYQFFASSPDDDRFLISAYGYSTKLFSLNPFQEVSFDKRSEIRGELISSPDKKFFISKDAESFLWRWTENGIENVDSGVAIPYPELMSVSPNADYLVYGDYESGESRQRKEILKIHDRRNNRIIFQIPVDYLMSGGLVSDEAAVSPDAKFLMISGTNSSNIKNTGIYEHYVFVINIETGLVIQTFSFENGVPFKLRVELLPISIRNNWTWEDY